MCVACGSTSWRFASNFVFKKGVGFFYFVRILYFCSSDTCVLWVFCSGTSQPTALPLVLAAQTKKGVHATPTCLERAHTHSAKKQGAGGQADNPETHMKEHLRRKNKTNSKDMMVWCLHFTSPNLGGAKRNIKKCGCEGNTVLNAERGPLLLPSQASTCTTRIFPLLHIQK